ncbi:uncharacterized protein LOC107479077 [Arachis duranensis]|uniref:Uncharacterized protein LOC107479077 n=1 Tax=Arachis duranensis TaxID=130453 RepID=A0A6P4CP21_ARADU|nr:uncharacterized protein LOC107479077 [Arachis duranensis]
MRVVWEELSYIVGLCQVPVCLLGDFNEILHVEERKGASSLTGTAEDFKDWVQDMQLMDLSLNDRKFTWFRGRSCSRIDRVLVTVEWMEEFLEIRLKGGPRGLLDHCPLIVEDPLRNWHKENFGNMDKRLKMLEEEIQKLDTMVNEGAYDGTTEARRKTLVSFSEKCEDQARIKVAIRGFYKELHRQEYALRIGFRDGLVRQIDGAEAAALETMPSVEEIREDFIGAVMEFFQTARLPSDANVTWVMLALKLVGAREIMDFRPIRRKIHDGVLIACETVQRLKTSRKKAAIIKLDFQKACDRVRWSFVDIVLQKMGFGQRWRNWVKEFLSTASMSVLVNGSPTRPFKMERGLRQGDPLSPLLFVLVVDVLHRMLGDAVRNRHITPLLVGRDHIELSHLQFADDTILFCPTETETIVNYKRMLRCFELMSGLSINFDKSNLIPINCEQEWVEQVCGLLGSKQAGLPVRYLGILLRANPRLVKTWKPIIDKVEEKLSLWKAKVLNKAGKLVLIKSVLNSLPIYYLSLYKMPKAVADKLIALQRRFMWCREDGSYVVDEISDLTSEGGPWKDICQLSIPNQQGKEKLLHGLAMEVGNGSRTLFWVDNWVQGGPPKVIFPRLFSISNQQGSMIGDCGFWDGLEWIWNFQWRRELFQWELELVHQLLERLRLVLQSETLSEEVRSYNFTSSIWGGLVWCAWLRYLGKPWVVPGTMRGQFESWTGFYKNREEQKMLLTGFFAVIWNIWGERKAIVFNNRKASVEDIQGRTFLSFKEWAGANPLGC